jgi:hypothetical protein
MARCPRGAWGPRRPAAGDGVWIGIRGGGDQRGPLGGGGARGDNVTRERVRAVYACRVAGGRADGRMPTVDDRNPRPWTLDI